MYSIKNLIFSSAIFLLVDMLVFSAFAQTLPDAKQTKKAIKKPEHNKQIVLRVFTDIVNNRDLSAIDELYNPNMVDHSAFPGQAPGAEGIKNAVKSFLTPFRS